jgi:DNA-binding response OmpR family regulator
MSTPLASILLATDADWLHDEVDAALADESRTVHRVRSGRVVVAAVRELEPELVVLDLQIGNLGGVATALALRQEEDMGRLGRRPIVMLLDRQADVFMAQMARADGWLVKPINSLRLRRAATNVLAGKDYFEGMLEPTS